MNETEIKALIEQTVSAYTNHTSEINECKKECDETDIPYTSADGIIDSVWSDLEDDFNLDWIDIYCQDFDKFIAWFNYVCVEYFSQEIIAIYKQRLLDFE